MTCTTELYSPFVKHIFDFRFRLLELPVSEKQPTSGLRSKPEVEKLAMQKLKVNCIHPQGFIPIRLVVSEEKRDQPLKKRDLTQNIVEVLWNFHRLCQYARKQFPSYTFCKILQMKDSHFHQINCHAWFEENQEDFLRIWLRLLLHLWLKKK